MAWNFPALVIAGLFLVSLKKGGFELKSTLVVILFLLITCSSVPAQSQTRESTEKPCREQPRLVGTCFSVRGRLSLYNGAPTIRLWRSGTKRMLGVSGSYAQPGYSSVPLEIERLLDWETEVWGDFKVCPLTRQRPREMQMICIESGKNLTTRKRQ